MIKPTVHINGTSAIDLFDGYRRTLLALQRARAELQDVTPHGRDYYPQGTDVIAFAIGEHVSRVQRIETVIAELEELSAHVYPQALAEKGRKTRA